MKSFLPPPLTSYFEKITEFIKEISELNGRKRKHMEIFFLFNYFPHLTQQDLQQLTSYSPGSISKILQDLQNVGTLAVKKVQLSKENTYYLPEPHLKLDYVTRSQSKDLVEKIVEYNQKLRNEMEYLVPEYDDSLLMENLDDFSKYYQWAHKFFENTEKTNTALRFNSHTLVKHAPRPLNPNFSKSFMKLEEKFIQFFVKRKIFEEMNEKNSIILGYFITRGTLTIAQLTELVPFSIATVSKSVHYLAEIQFIQKNQDSYGYALFSFSIGWLNYRQYYYRRVFSWTSLFQDFEKEIENDLDRFHFLPEFPPFYYFFRKLLHLCKNYKTIHEKWQFLWEEAQEFVTQSPQFYPSLVK